MAKKRFHLLTIMMVTCVCMGLLPSCSPEGPDTDFQKPEEQKPAETEQANGDDDKHGIAYLYDGAVLPEIHITFPLDQFNALLTAFDRNKNTKASVHCDIKYVKGSEVTKISDAGIRLRGNTSRRRPEGSNGKMHDASGVQWHHCHWQINFHKFEKDDDHKVHGAKKVMLKWFKDDPSYAREPYCHDLFRRFGIWTAANNAYCRVFVKVEGDKNEAYLGVYDMMEPIDEDFLKVRKGESQFANAKGYLWKCRFGASLKSTNSDFGADLDTEEEHVYELKTNTDDLSIATAQFKGFIKNLNNLNGEAFQTWIESVCDVEMLMRTYAVNVAVGMWDDYWNNSNNYYLYFNSTNPDSYKVWFIPYDYDNTLGTCNKSGVLEDSGRQDPFHWGNTDNNPLIGKILSVEKYRDMYSNALLELREGANGHLDRVASAQRIRTWQNAVMDYVSNDTGEDMTISDSPASWGNHSEYRITDTGSSNNYFKIKAETIKQYCK